ncbi:hypothetical protein [Xanthomarina sp. GH4-25]|uniref:hypothetical protein n=1 Tax=Xanthomarina sp. GH4-25 TaxID=3349335 RepID=UPI000D67A808|nr:hypothetical protein DI383_10395 [Flavobacteriaceae bacterium LYZ1037]
MQYTKQHILFRVFTVLLVLAVLAPSVVKLSHAYSHTNHKHEICLGEKQVHFHTLDVDCEFHKFQLNTAFTIPVNTFKVLKKQNNHQLINSQYHFISEFQQLHFSLRGPPINS